MILKEEHIDQVYSYLKRTPKADYVNLHLHFLAAWEQEQKEDVIAPKFAAYLKERIEKGKSVKEFIDLSDLEKTKSIFAMLSLVENNKQSCYIREFSIWHFADSKAFEGEGELPFQKGRKTVVDLACLEQGIGISGADVNILEDIIILCGESF